MELSGRVQELQNEVNCMNDFKDFQDAESVRSGNSHVTSQPMLFPKHPVPGGMLKPFCGSRPRYVLVHNFLRKRCNGSRKWSWLIQWMI